MTNQPQPNQEEFDREFEKEWRRFEKASPTEFISLPRETAMCWAKWAWQLQAERLKQAEDLKRQWVELFSTTLLALRHFTAPGTTRDIDAPRLAREMWQRVEQAEQSVAQLEQEIEEAIKDDCDYCKQNRREAQRVGPGQNGEGRWVHKGSV